MKGLELKKRYLTDGKPGRPPIAHEWVDDVEYAYCGSCKLYYPVKHFSPDNTRYHGIANRCKDCNNRSSKRSQRREFVKRIEEAIEIEDIIQKCAMKDQASAHKGSGALPREVLPNSKSDPSSDPFGFLD